MYGFRTKNTILKKAYLELLKVKDSYMRMDVILQGNLAVDKGVHVGGSFSEMIPLVTMVYGGFLKIDVENPTSLENDSFVLSKGHGVAGMAAVLSDLGFFPREIFRNARCYESILNGHPGPILPGVQIATGPLGQGISAAVGMAQAQQVEGCGNTFSIMGDGEIQEGIPWEAFLYAGEKHLNNLCIVIDYNRGQNDDTSRLVLTLGDLKAKFEAFDFEVYDIDGTKYETVFDAFERFENRVSDKPFVIISNCKKGESGFGKITESHKTTMDDYSAKIETALQEKRRDRRVAQFCRYLAEAMESACPETEALLKVAGEMNLRIVCEGGKPVNLERVFSDVKVRQATPRDKKLRYNEVDLPKLEVGKWYKCSNVISDGVAVFAQDPKMVTLDADMGVITGLQVGMWRTNQALAINAGIAESNMMGMAEGFAVRGYNAWCATFGMFFDWRVLRRISVSQQERQEVIEKKDGWLTAGHGLDLTFLAAAANIDTQINGATHMSIDDANALMTVPGLKVIDVACPRMMLSVMKWIAEGDRGLVLLRMTRADSEVVYGSDFVFEYGKGYAHGDIDAAAAVIITSGRGIYEGFSAQMMLAEQGVVAAVVDMPSFDKELCMRLVSEDKCVVFVEQNNGFLFEKFMMAAYKNGLAWDPKHVVALNSLNGNGEPRHLHSGTYRELMKVCGTQPKNIVEKVLQLTK